VSGSLTVGFYGKLPARGDFVRAGLPRDFTDRWDDWLQSVIAGSRAQMGDSWLPAFLEAPVWRFALPSGMCGARAALGLMLPSVDKAGRYFPLAFVALSEHDIDAAESGPGNAWLDQCEAAGRAALEQDTPPQEISEMLGSPDLPEVVTRTAEGVWWSEGSPRVKAGRIVLRSLPDVATYAAMLGAGTDGTKPAADIAGHEPTGETTWESPS
jgi:type VI secretion system protein ImpM